MSLPSFLRSVPILPAPPFAPQGPVGTVPPLHRSYCGAPTSRRPDNARFPSRGRSGSRRRRRDLPGSWATLAHVPCSQTPAGPLHRRGPGPFSPASWCIGFAFRLQHGVGSRDNELFGAPSHGPCARCLRFAGSVARLALHPRKTRFRLTASCLGGRDFHPRVALRSFRRYLLPLRPGFSWRTSDTS